MTQREAANVDEPTRRPRSPLAELFLAAQSAPPDDAAQVYVQSVPFVGQVAVRGRLEDEAFKGAIRNVLGLELPMTVGGVVEVEAYRTIWLGPDHWLVITNEGEGPALVQSLKSAFGGLFAAAIDVSGARMRLRLAGPAARDVLASGCTLNLDPDAFPSGQALQTPVGNVSAVLHCLQAGDSTGDAASHNELTYDLYVPRSQALSFWQWLQHAGRPYGLSIRA
jgi:sarcosine oxidase subunit gamma